MIGKEPKTDLNPGEKEGLIDQRIFDHERNFHGVKGMILIGDKMLVYRRDNKTERFPLSIDLPGGGREPGESPFETFCRETKEEFGLNITEKDIVYAKQHISSIDQSKEGYFIVVKPATLEADDIVFGDEGLEPSLITVEDYLKLKDAISRHQDRVREYLGSL